MKNILLAAILWFVYASVLPAQNTQKKMILHVQTPCTLKIGLFGTGAVTIDWGTESKTGTDILAGKDIQYYSFKYSKEAVRTVTVTGENITTLLCGDQNLTGLEVSNNIVLEQLGCGKNDLSALDVSKNTALIYLHCDHNQLTNLDISKNIALKGLWCYHNQITG